jgi:glucosamine-6-phosphate deaminase
MKTHIFENSEQGSRFLSVILSNAMSHGKNLCLATGQTMEPVYAQLSPLASESHFFMLDELCGLNEDHPESYRFFLKKHFFCKIQAPSSHIHLPLMDSPDCVAKDYLQQIQNVGGLDLVLLGIGTNGHMGLNEPFGDESLSAGIVDIAAETKIKILSKQVTKAFTLGPQVILAAREIILVAWGEGKAEIMKNFFETSPSMSLPASLIKRHKNVSVLIDKSACKK